MQRRYHPVDLHALRTNPVVHRHHKENVSRMAQLPEPGASAAELLASFPGTLGAQAF